jgi:hypothetical protein
VALQLASLRCFATMAGEIFCFFLIRQSLQLPPLCAREREKENEKEKKKQERKRESFETCLVSLFPVPRLLGCWFSSIGFPPILALLVGRGVITQAPFSKFPLASSLQQPQH